MDTLLEPFSVGTMYFLDIKATAEDILHDFEAMRENGITLVRFWIHWEWLENENADYDYSHADYVFIAAEATGLKLMPTISLYPPLWLTASMVADGTFAPGRYPNLSHPRIWQPLSAFIRNTVLRYRESPMLALWNVWNEPTLNTTRSDFRLQQFADWLHTRYTTIQALQKAWCDESPVFQALCPHSLQELTSHWLNMAFTYGDRRNSSMRYDWYRFCADAMVSELKQLCDTVHLYDTVHPCHVNQHSLNSNPLYSARDLFASANAMDTISCSFHIGNDYTGGKEYNQPMTFNAFSEALCWSWNKGKRHTMVGEIQAGVTDSRLRRFMPTAHDITFSLCQALGEGLDGVVFWIWRGWHAGMFELGESSLRNSSDGGPTQRSEAVHRFSEAYHRYSQSLGTLKRSPASIAIFYSQSTHIYRQVLNDERPFNLANEHQFALFGCFRALRDANYQTDFISEQEILDGVLANYRVLYMPSVEVVTPAIAQALQTFVSNGGHLYADGRSGWLDDFAYLRNTVPGNGLDALFGVAETDYVINRDATAFVTGGTTVHGIVAQSYLRLADSATVSGRCADGSAAVADHSFGKGRTRYVCTAVCRHLYDFTDSETAEWLVSFAAQSGVVPDAELPAGMTSRHLTGKTGEAWVLSNHTDASLPFAVPFQGTAASSFYNTPAAVKDGRLYGVLPPETTEIFIAQ